MDKTVLNVLYQSSDYYSLPTAVSIASLLENNTNLDEINIYLLDDNINSTHLDRIERLCSEYSRNLTVIDTRTIQDTIQQLDLPKFNGSYTTYYKLFAINEIEFPTDYVLYLDGDTIITGSLAPLLNIEMNDDEIIGGVIDLYLNDYKSIIGLDSNDYYFNAGVLLINKKAWVKCDCLNKIIHHLVEDKAQYSVADQDILNVLFNDHFKILSPTYNFNACYYLFGINDSIRLYGLQNGSYYSSSEICSVMDGNPLIIHCLGGMSGRPWEQNNWHPQNELFDTYLALTPWTLSEKYTPNKSLIFQLQEIAYKTLPKKLYLRLHAYMLKSYLKKREQKQS